MTPRERTDWSSAPPIPEEYRELMESTNRAIRNAIAAQMGALVVRVYPTETTSVIPSSFQCPHLKEPAS